MEFIISLIMIAIVIYFIVTVVIPLVLAVSGLALSFVSLIAFIFGLFSAVKNYIIAIKNNLNFLHWEWTRDSEPATRSYFFGPGYVQLFGTIRDSFRLNAGSGKKVLETADDIRGFDDGLLGFVRAVGKYAYIIVGYICIYFIGTVLCGVLGLIHGTITTVVMIVTYIIFTFVWATDRIYLMKNKIRSDCPTCHSRFLVPMFMCPDCGAMHSKLVPGPYGIWKHKCTCGRKLPSTFLNGRSNLEAFCPDCGSNLVASDARPIVFQLVGGTSSGKTVYLSAFYNKFLEMLRGNRNLRVTITDQYKPYFQDLEEWFKGAECPATAQLNSQMYPVLIDSELGVKRQFSIYDIAGEMFDGYTADAEIQQQQFHYCDGLLFMIDPFSSGTLRMKRMNDGEDLSGFSEMAVEDVTTNFINYLIQTGHAKANSRCNIPISVLIAKSDIREVKREIGPAKIKSLFEKNEEEYGTYDNARDSICRQFLMDIGLHSTVENLETQFSNLHYFPVSAMGHDPDGTDFDPWGILEPIEWMLPLADKELNDLIYPPEVPEEQI